MKYGTEIIKMLEELDIVTNNQVKNTIDMLAYEVYNKGKEDGIEEGKEIGIIKACREMEKKIGIIRSKSNEL